MKRIVMFLFLQSSLSIIAMEQPVATPSATTGATANQIAQAARKRIILEGPDAKLHEENSFLWAYTYPHAMKFSQEGIEFPHYKHKFVIYTKRWEEVYSVLSDLKKEQEGVDKDKQFLATVQMLAKEKSPVATLSEKLAIQKIFIFQISKNIHAYPPQAIIPQELYREALYLGQWQQLPDLVSQFKLAYPVKMEEESLKATTIMFKLHSLGFKAKTPTAPVAAATQAANGSQCVLV